ncbi:hypothetical protein LRP52_37430 [Photobacterium sp. ZSDE20]|uniref:Uncharacterized protein n=1 Tax=Photobacterium pectinilyticum TaxID=2906793 RepID=A0ABT1N1F0_9GAMM|nr:hypothetical protein [Photobacterium sp. ZSDE20]MCQ1058352.1 hypothetical protein [Photobacterium sp. ZSDE20]MDD1827871.1 hypothetical protein [Photobacterium sp. ZSDE20]
MTDLTHRYTTPIFSINESSKKTLVELLRFVKPTSVNNKMLNACISLYNYFQNNENRNIELKDILDDEGIQVSDRSAKRFIQEYVKRGIFIEEPADKAQYNISTTKTRLITVKSITDLGDLEQLLNDELPKPKKLVGRASKKHAKEQFNKINVYEPTQKLKVSASTMLNAIQNSLSGLVVPGKEIRGRKECNRKESGAVDFCVSVYGVTNEYDAHINKIMMTLTHEYMHQRKLEGNLPEDLNELVIPIYISQIVERLGLSGSGPEREAISRSIIRNCSTTLTLRNANEYLGIKNVTGNPEVDGFKLIDQYKFISSREERNVDGNKQFEYRAPPSQNNSSAQYLNKQLERDFNDVLPFSAVAITWHRKVMRHIAQLQHFQSVNKLIFQLAPSIANLYSLLLEDYSLERKQFTDDNEVMTCTIMDIGKSLWPYEDENDQKKLTHKLLKTIIALETNAKPSLQGFCEKVDEEGDSATFNLELMGFSIELFVPYAKQMRRISNLSSQLFIRVDNKKLLEFAEALEHSESSKAPSVPSPFYQNSMKRETHLPVSIKKMEEKIIIDHKSYYYIYEHRGGKFRFILSQYTEEKDIAIMCAEMANETGYSHTSIEMMLEKHRSRKSLIDGLTIERVREVSEEGFTAAQIIEISTAKGLHRVKAAIIEDAILGAAQLRKALEKRK